MPRPPGSSATPSYRLHRPSGQAVVTIDGTDFYLGIHGTKLSKAEYDRLVGEWLAGGRRLSGHAGMTIIEVIDTYWKHVQQYYANPGGSCGEIESYRLALAKLRALYGHTDVQNFGPLALKTVRDAMVKDGWCRGYINSQVGRVRRMFKWAVEQELVGAETWHALQAVAGLRAGKTIARESSPVKPVPPGFVEAVLLNVAPPISAMITLQLLTGMRPGEVCQMRGGDLDTTGQLWSYRPLQHKTKHHGHDRVIYFGPKAQEVLKLFHGSTTGFLFRPTDAVKWHRDLRTKARTTPFSCGNVPGSNRVGKPRRQPGERYTVNSYGLAIKRACDRVFIPPAELAQHAGESREQWHRRLTAEQREELRQWQLKHRWHPHQLRHSAATAIRRTFGLEAAQVILGHRTLAVTEIYAEKNVAAAQRIMKEVG